MLMAVRCFIRPLLTTDKRTKKGRKTKDISKRMLEHLERDIKELFFLFIVGINIYEQKVVKIDVDSLKVVIEGEVFNKKIK